MRITVSLRLFGPLTLSQTDPWPAAILVDELDAGGFAGLPYHDKRRATGFRGARLYLPDSYDPDPSPGSEFLLAPVKEGTRRPALCRRDHSWTMPV